MKRLLTFTVLFIAVVSTAAVSYAEPFAKRFELPSKEDDLFNESLYRFLKDKKIPERSEVPIPPCPGALFLGAWERGEIMEIDGKGVECINTLKFYCPSPPEKISAFYKKALAGKYESIEVYKNRGYDHFFWAGPDKKIDRLLSGKDTAEIINQLVCEFSILMISREKPHEGSLEWSTTVEISYP